MTVRDYYEAHFDELSEEKQFHFATRLKNWFDVNDFDEFLAEHEPHHDLEKILANDDYSRVNFLEERRPFFEKYTGLYGLEATLFRILHLWLEYEEDLREDFDRIYGREKLWALCDELREDDEAFFVLTTWAVNVLALTEELFPRGIDIYQEMIEKALAGCQNATSIYLYTHIILCESQFYRKKKLAHEELYRQALVSCDRIIEDYFEKVSMDMKFEFLVCARMVGYEPKCREAIRIEADDNKDDYIFDPRQAGRIDGLDKMEHRNVLYIMSELESG